MMTGTVTAEGAAVLRVTLFDANGRPHDYDAIIDTGYNGTFTLPPAVIAALGLRRIRFERSRLADGTEVLFDVYEGVLLWDGQPVTILIDEIASDSLIGMALMRDYELNLPVRVGATFTLRPLPNP